MKIQRAVSGRRRHWVARSLPSRPSVPILAGLRIEQRETRLSFELRLRDVHEDQRAGNRTKGCHPRLGQDAVEYRGRSRQAGDEAEDACRLTCGGARFTLQTLPLAEYPELPATEATGTVDSALFPRRCTVSVAAGRDELLPVFTVRSDRWRHTVSAGHRPVPDGTEVTWNPASALQRAALVPTRPGRHSEVDDQRRYGDAEPLRRRVRDGLVGFSGEVPGVRETTTRLRTGNPRVRHLMNIQPTLTVHDTTELAAAVKRISLAAERNTSAWSLRTPA